MPRKLHTDFAPRTAAGHRFPPLFTLVELLIVIGIIMILMSMLLPALKKTRDLSKRLNCINNEKTIGQGVHMYASDNQDFVPVFGGYYTNSELPSGGGWATNGEWQEYLAGKYLSYRKTTDKGVFTCPAHESPWNLHGLRSSYGFNYWIQEPNKEIRFFQVIKPSQLLMLGDSVSGRLLIRGPLVASGTAIHCRHSNGANLTFIDGHVQCRQISELADYSAGDPFWFNL